MTLTEAKANEIAEFLRDDEPIDDIKVIAFDPMTILMLVSVIISGIRMLQACNKTPIYAQQTIRGDGIIARLHLRKLIREKSAALPWSERRDLRKRVEKAVRSVGQRLTIEDLAKLFDEAAQ